MLAKLLRIFLVGDIFQYDFTLRLENYLGLRGASLTSTAYDRITETDTAILDESIVKYSRVKKKGTAGNHINLTLN